MRVVCLLSGGLDSSVLLYHFLADEKVEAVHALGFQYDQRHGIELQRAQKIVGEIQSPKLNGFKLIDLRPIGISGQGRYVPGRNAVFGVLAANFAVNNNYDSVAFSLHPEDSVAVPDARHVDTRPEFFQRLGELFKVFDQHKIQVLIPYVNWGFTRAQIVKEGHHLGVPMADTWSCWGPVKRYGVLLQCGKCLECQLRRDAFKKAGIADKTEYAD